MLLTLVASLAVCTPSPAAPSACTGARVPAADLAMRCVAGTDDPAPVPAIEDAPAPHRWLSPRRDPKPVGLAAAAAAPPPRGAQTLCLAASWPAGFTRRPGPRSPRAPPRPA